MAEMASDQLDELMGVLGRMRDAADRLASSSGDDDAFREAATDASLLFLELKATNRAALEGVEATRASTAKAKLDLDHKRLELQNVLYEKGHIQKEIRACQDFRSAYDDETIGLCSVAEFKRQAPGEWKEAGDDPHALMLKRLSHELAKRKKISKCASFGFCFASYLELSAVQGRFEKLRYVSTRNVNNRNTSVS